MPIRMHSSPSSTSRCDATGPDFPVIPGYPVASRLPIEGYPALAPPRDRASRLVCAMKEAFADMVKTDQQLVLNFPEGQELDPNLPPTIKRLVEITNTRSVLAIVVHDSGGRKAFGVMLESERDGYFTPQQGPRKGLENADPARQPSTPAALRVLHFRLGQETDFPFAP